MAADTLPYDGVVEWLGSGWMDNRSVSAGRAFRQRRLSPLVSRLATELGRSWPAWRTALDMSNRKPSSPGIVRASACSGREKSPTSRALDGVCGRTRADSNDVGSQPTLVCTATPK